VATTIEHCPTGALHYTRKDGGPAEAPAEQASLHIVADGPIYVRGAVTVKNPAGETLLEDTRVALCRCGVSHNKPLCDNSHGPAGFAAGDALAQNLHKSDAGLAGAAALTITPQVDGPVLVEGDFSLHSSDGAAVYQGKKVWLCRCGASANKPFCDGTHKRTGFTAP
jgi:CDGSH-type Zn-finger protein